MAPFLLTKLIITYQISQGLGQLDLEISFFSLKKKVSVGDCCRKHKLNVTCLFLKRKKN